jgi:DNA-binding NarL/FixJ family response regulator
VRFYATARTELDSQFFHAVIFDQRLLDRNPEETLQELHTLYPWLAVVAETATLPDAARLAALGADFTLPSPCKRNDLTICNQRVQRLFRQKTALHK